MKIEANTPIHRLLEKAYHEVAGGTKILLGNLDGIIFAVSPEQIEPVAKLLKTVTLEN